MCISSRVCPHIPPCDIQIMKVRIFYRDTPTPNNRINKCDMSSKSREVTSYFYVIPKCKRENSTMTRFQLQKSGLPDDCQFQNTLSWNFNYVFNQFVVCFKMCSDTHVATWLYLRVWKFIIQRLYNNFHVLFTLQCSVLKPQMK